MSKTGKPQRKGHMSNTIRLEVLDRRTFVLGGVGAAALSALLPLGQEAFAQDASAIDAMLKKVLGDAKPTEGKVAIDLPEIAENGNTVPFTVSVESPMTDKENVKSVLIIATGNPAPDVATFSFTPQSGKAVASSRMRLGKTQDVYAIAQMSDGKYFVGKRSVKVTIGGCGG